MNAPAQYSFENLTQSGLIKANAKDNRDVSLSVNCFGGSTQFSVFTGNGARPVSISLQRQSIHAIVILLKKMRENIRAHKETVFLNTWDPDNKRMKQVGQIGFGIDENMTFQFEIAHNDLNGRHIFPIKPNSKVDFSNSSLSEKETIESILNWLIQTFEIETVVAERLTSFKRPNTGGGGGNRGGSFGGNRQNSGGGNRDQNSFGSGGNQGGGSRMQVEDDLVL